MGKVKEKNNAECDEQFNREQAHHGKH